MGRTNRRYSKSERQNHLKKQSKSGLSIAEYCRKHNVGISTFDNWKRKARQSNPPRTEFVELPLPQTAPELEVHCGNFSVLIPSSTDVDHLTKILTAMNRAVS